MIWYVIAFLAGAVFGVLTGIVVVFKDLRSRFPKVYLELVYGKEIREYEQLKNRE
jgi:hypothetical protein